ncbi:MAG: LEA type 2 family protein [Chitinophagaceae bacterium]
MKRGIKWGSPALAVLLAGVLLGSCSKPKPLVFKGVNQFKVGDVGTDSSTLFAELVFSNPNDMKLDFKKLDCQIFANNQLVGHYVQDSVTHVLPGQDFTYPAKIRVDMRPIVQNALATFLSGTVDLHFLGNVKVGRGGFFANIPIDFSHKQKLRF